MTVTLIKDLIEVPERVHKGDFVLRLTEGVTAERVAATLRDYVVTPQLVQCFDKALGLIQSALQPPPTSKAAYLHGSFGAGKSHFMAVLHLLLQHHPEARSVAELQPLLAKHRGWIEGKKFLLVPYHMIGARSMESAILGGYVDHVQRLHPTAPPPAVYRADELLENADSLRRDVGDELFFRGLNRERGPGTKDDGWGELATSWDAGTYDKARRAGPRSDVRASLVADLVRTHFSAFQKLAAEGEHLVSLDEGLSALSKHAKTLGYDGLILFLDELVLWLASRMADEGFVTREGQKVAKLVEAAKADRPIPIVSFVARQRDLRELVGDHVPGSEKLSFADVLKWWEGRFDLITLEDRNLPVIAERRVLRPRSEAARQQIQQAFDQTTKVREDVMDVLLTSQADRQLFRQVYPFSPAFVQTLVAVSSALQRERTALKMLVLYLVQRRDDLALGEVAPVGDLFDLISEGDEPFSAEMAAHFANARQLYHRKLLPMLEKEHEARWEDLKGLPSQDPKVRGFFADARILKTLLLAALAPEVESLKNLTAGRLAALNHGTIKSPIPGREAQLVLQKVRRWAGLIGEIKLTGDDANPTIAVQVSGVDTDEIINNARGHFDNKSNRRRAVLGLVFKQLGLGNTNETLVRHKLVWRGTEREVDVLFGNVRELPFASLKADAPCWKVVIDFPFDEEGSAQDDVNQVQRFRRDEKPTQSLAWLPTFLSVEAQRDLATLVVLDHLLAGERFNQYASHLAPVDRQTAKVLLENRQSQLRQHLVNVLDAAYGIATPLPKTLDETHSLEGEHVRSLDTSFEPRPPVGANLADAFKHVVDQALKHQFKAHPDFTGEKADDAVKPTQARKVLDELRRVVAEGDHGRAEVEKPLRGLLKRIAVPLGLGIMHESAFELGHTWPQHVDRCHARDKGELSVGRMRAWLDEPDPRGLPAWAQDLVILSVAAQTQKSFVHHGGPFEAELGDLPDDAVLREQPLPPADVWEEARKRADGVLGKPGSKLLNASNVAKLEADVLAVVTPLREPARNLVKRLEAACQSLAVPASAAARLTSSRVASRLVEDVLSTSAEERLAALARAPLDGCTYEAVGTSLKQAGTVGAVLESAKWQLFEAIGRLADGRRERAQRVLGALRDALGRDELAVALPPALRHAEDEATRLLVEEIDRPPLPPLPPPPRPRKPEPAVEEDKGELKGLDAERVQELAARIAARLAKNPGASVTVSWKIEERGTDSPPAPPRSRGAR